MKRLIIKKILLLCLITHICSPMIGCGKRQTAIGSTSYSFATGAECISDTFYCYRTRERQTEVLDYSTLNKTLLCNKPNCNHTGDDCLIKRLNGNVPVFGENCAYYFVDAQPEIAENDEGKADLKLNSTLYRYDFETNSEEKLLQIDGKCVGFNQHGWMLRDDTLYFIEDAMGRNYDESGVLLSSNSSGAI